MTEQSKKPRPSTAYYRREGLEFAIKAGEQGADGIINTADAIARYLREGVQAPERQSVDADMMVRPYLDDYSFEGDNGSYSPTDIERTLLEDALHGFIAEFWPHTPNSAEAAREGVAAVRRLLIAARTSGGTAGTDQGLIRACCDVEDALLKSGWPSVPAAADDDNRTHGSDSAVNDEQGPLTYEVTLHVETISKPHDFTFWGAEMVHLATRPMRFIRHVDGHITGTTRL